MQNGGVPGQDNGRTYHRACQRAASHLIAAADPLEALAVKTFLDSLHLGGFPNSGAALFVLAL